MVRINDTTTYPNTTPALADHVIGTDVSDTTNSTDGEVVTFTLQAIKDLIEANLTPSGFQFISSQDASASATLDFTGFDASSYDSYVFILQNIIPASSSQSLLMRTSTDGGSTYDSGSGNYEWAQHGMINSGAHAQDNISGQTSIKITGDQANTYVSTTAGVSGRVEVLGPHLSQYTMVNAGLSYLNNNGNRPAIINTAGHRESAADVDAVRFLFSSGNIASGTITMYGLRNG